MIYFYFFKTKFKIAQSPKHHIHHQSPTHQASSSSSFFSQNKNGLSNSERPLKEQRTNKIIITELSPSNSPITTNGAQNKPSNGSGGNGSVTASILAAPSAGFTTTIRTTIGDYLYPSDSSDEVYQTTTKITQNDGGFQPIKSIMKNNSYTDNSTKRNGVLSGAMGLETDERSDESEITKCEIIKGGTHYVIKADQKENTKLIDGLLKQARAYEYDE